MFSSNIVGEAVLANLIDHVLSMISRCKQNTYSLMLPLLSASRIHLLGKIYSLIKGNIYLYFPWPYEAQNILMWEINVNTLLWIVRTKMDTHRPQAQVSTFKWLWSLICYDCIYHLKKKNWNLTINHAPTI